MFRPAASTNFGMFVLPHIYLVAIDVIKNERRIFVTMCGLYTHFCKTYYTNSNEAPAQDKKK